MKSPAFPSPMTDSKPPIAGDASSESVDGWEARPHDFEVQKQLHQQIRNDPDYDDWEYGTEPLPHEAWVARQKAQQAQQQQQSPE
jgi:hypothetical protein